MEKRNFMRKLLICIIIIFGISCISFSSYNAEAMTNVKTTNYINIIIHDSIKYNVIKRDTLDSIVTKQIVKERIKNELIDVVNKYIRKQSPNSNQSIPEKIVENGLKYDIDICFIMAQTQLETNFGVTGIGKTRKSLFGIMGKRYSTYEDAIDGYTNLLVSSYLTNGKTEQSLLKHYVNKNGYRYGGKNYEIHLNKHYKQIINKTNITDLQEKYKNA